MQEEVEQRVVTLIVNCTKLTEQELRKALGKLLTHLKTQHQTKQPHGKMTVKKLAAQNRGLQSVEVTDQNIGSFNKTDNYYVQAKLNQEEGVYYVTGHTPNKEDATHFVPVKTGDTKGRILIKGLEDDTYAMTEVRTDNGYVLLKQDIEVKEASNTENHRTRIAIEYAKQQPMDELVDLNSWVLTVCL